MKVFFFVLEMVFFAAQMTCFVLYWIAYVRGYDADAWLLWSSILAVPVLICMALVLTF